MNLSSIIISRMMGVARGWSNADTLNPPYPVRMLLSILLKPECGRMNKVGVPQYAPLRSENALVAQANFTRFEQDVSAVGSPLPAKSMHRYVRPFAACPQT